LQEHAVKRRERLAASTAIEQERANTSNDHDDGDDAVGIDGVGNMLDVSDVSVWRMVKAGAIPAPFYPRSRCPRWLKREIREARERLRMMPSEAKAAHRAEKLARERRQTPQPTAE
jgi:hypothetical protein